jgi:hypothetical protein
MRSACIVPTFSTRLRNRIQQKGKGLRERRAQVTYLGTLDAPRKLFAVPRARITPSLHLRDMRLQRLAIVFIFIILCPAPATYIQQFDQITIDRPRRE